MRYLMSSSIAMSWPLDLSCSAALGIPRWFCPGPGKENLGLRDCQEHHPLYREAPGICLLRWLTLLTASAPWPQVLT